MASADKNNTARIKREIDEALRSRRKGKIYGSRIQAVSEAAPETQRDVLRDLNRKYNLAFEEPWRMLAYLRRLADQLGMMGQRDSDRFLRVISDHGRLRRAPDAF